MIKKYNCKECKKQVPLIDLADNNSGNCYDCEAKKLLNESPYYKNFLEGKLK